MKMMILDTDWRLMFIRGLRTKKRTNFLPLLFVKMFEKKNLIYEIHIAIQYRHRCHQLGDAFCFPFLFFNDRSNQVPIFYRCYHLNILN